MLLSFPTELVEHIVRLTGPPEYSSATYLERQDTLRQVCLVCRDLKDVAQPVLQEVVRVSKEVTVERVKEHFQSMTAKRRLRVLALESVDFDLSVVGEGCARLQDVRMTEMDKVDLRTVERFSALRHLVLSECELLDTPIALPALTTLTWSNSRSSDGEIKFLRPPSVPSLRHINYFVEAQEAGIDDAPILALPPALLAQLTTLVITFPLAGVPVTSSQPLVLLETSFKNLSSSDFQYLLSRDAYHIRAFVPLTRITPTEVPTALQLLAAALAPANTPSTSLRLLYLPTLCRPSPCRDEDVATEVEKLLAVCAARGIEVDYEDTDESAGGSLTSPKFSAYARRLRAKERAEEGVRRE
ncbi:hypothetical protein JCM6882_008349 [Rhodosporidiobolus microsporus]